jgi:NADH-quinone oxidoreductase subunit G
MSDALVTLKIEGIEVTVPKGTLLVDAAKQVGIHIPVFCYHPSLKPVGMCRMCLVEIGRPSRDRSSGEILRDEDGQPIIQFGDKLEIACTAKVEDGWVVKVDSEKAIEGRKQIIEFILTSHPLDCPICDKGGECPLQTLTMKHGPGESRFLFEEKKNLDKRVPLGELIFLDRERCIQCSRCVRFQEEIAGDPVLQFINRGRDLEIVTFSKPGFDSYFSGNTTDICPVGALTTADFRFGARPWELNAAASICPHCPVGCNITLNTRREAKSGGAEVVKRILPRQNQAINGTWICDKGRFAHAFAGSPERLSHPMIRKDGELVKVSWDDALERAKEILQEAGNSVVGLASGRTSNEDLFNFRSLVEGLDGKAYFDSGMAGGELIQKVGVGAGSDLSTLEKGDVVLVIASDLLEEAPIWWLQVKGAAERGAEVIVANARNTKLDKYASIKLDYAYGEAVHTALGLIHTACNEKSLEKFGKDSSVEEAGKVIKEAENAVIFFGSEGLDYSGSLQLAEACASLLALTDHVGRANNGLIAVWPQNNTQGAWDMGLTPIKDGLVEILSDASVIYLMGTDPIGDYLEVADQIPDGTKLIVQELFHTPSVDLAEVVFPAQSFIEREGTYTSGQRIVQRFFMGVSPLGETLPDWQIIAKLGALLGVELNTISAAGVMRQLVSEISDYEGLDNQSISRVKQQWPLVGERDKYFGGSAYKNRQGLGFHLSPATERGEEFAPQWSEPEEGLEGEGFLLVPITVLYDRGTTVGSSEVLEPRLSPSNILLNPDDAVSLDLGEQTEVEMRMNGYVTQIAFKTRREVPSGVVLLPRSVGIPINKPVYVDLKPVE